ncbi:MAG: hypothetical protein DRH57_01500 [Candidatus Cloacimonadota bacterium]|nr:MAG: hypothetical protein DRH57_01500 [Candidatus Cloacimonadota bacterium]
MDTDTNELLDFMEPIKAHIIVARNKESELSDVKRAIKISQRYMNEDKPHDFMLYADDLTALRIALDKNFSIEEYPELWI